MRNHHKLFLSVDMDEWYQCRWATGSANAFWHNLKQCWQDIYGSNKPVGEIYTATDKILGLFDELSFKSTFFFTGIIAELYPDLVKKISNEGHEIACHNYHHRDYAELPHNEFLKDLENSKKLLEDISGKEVIGYRSPNSSIPDSLVCDLEKAGFIYDSSITPTRKIFGKFGNFIHTPRKPYHPSYEDIGEEGDAKLWEFPWATFPIVKTPAGSGITHRILGNLYNAIAAANSLQRGHSSYYFHPYEIDQSEYLTEISRKRIFTRLFVRRIGPSFYQSLKNFLEKYQEILISGEELVDLCNMEINFQNESISG